MDATGPLPEQIGPYRIVSLLGQGGMGTVFLGEQREPVRRRVAVKVVKLGMDSQQVLARFDAERQALALMDHPNVARVYDAGTTDRGQPWFAMEWVQGDPITEYCDARRLGLDARIELMQAVCAGGQHAHHRGIMHRDLKPSNVLVTERDGQPVPKVIDFGLAKAMQQPLVEGTLFTEQGQILGTPEYMSPEQAGTTGVDVDSRTDVYALAVLLYELLTGELPFRRDELMRAGYSGMLKMIVETDPPKPSTRITTLGDALPDVARCRRLAEDGLRRGLRGDLDWIVMRGLAKDRARRYQTPNELADDLERHRRLDPVLAGPPDAGYRLRRFVRRRKGAVIATAAIFLSLVAGTVVATWFAIEASAQAERAGERQRDFDQLAFSLRLDLARERGDALNPAWPERTEALEAWLRDEWGPLETAAPSLRETVQRLDARLEDGAGTDADRFLCDTLRAELVEFAEAEQEDAARVRRDLTWARAVDALTREHPSAPSTWEDVREQWPDLAPQHGLVPIGRNPATGHWEFYHLRSAGDPLAPRTPAAAAALPIPTHRADGSIEPFEGMGLVFVLLPGGTATMGNLDDAVRGTALAEPDEWPTHEVSLAPFLVSKFEMTQGQWAALTGGDLPSGYPVGGEFEGIGRVTWIHPVEQVSWTDADRVLRAHGLDLPTEAQWEFACRAGSRTAWWPGDRLQDLEGTCNVLDETAARLYPNWGPPAPFDDGFAGPTVIGTYRANPWGLHDLHGNVMEWCRDLHGSYDDPVRAGAGR